MTCPLAELRRRRCLGIGLGLTLLPAPWLVARAAASTTRASDADVMRGIAVVLARLKQYHLGMLPTAQAALWRDRQLPSGGWPDVDYGSRAAGWWPPIVHLERLQSMAAAWCTPGHPLYGQDRVLQGVHGGLRMWFSRRPGSDNWWHNTIGQPLGLAPIPLLLQQALAPELLHEVQAALLDPDSVPPDRATGQNRVWYATEQLVRGVLRRDETDLQAARDAFQATLVITRGEGLQSDGSFHQHDAQLYSGGYGLGFLQDLSRIATWLTQTPWAIGDAPLQRLATYALNGLCPLVRGPWLDWSARGREFSRQEERPRTEVLLQGLQTLEALVPAQAAALRDAASSIRAGTPSASSLGNRHYWRSDFMVHQTPAAYVSVKMCSARTVGTESGNGENLQGYWLPFGLTYLLQRGDEYESMPWLWDWSSLPGVTAPAMVPAFTGYQRHGASFVGGVSNGQSGVAAMVLDKLQTSARKAWFLHEDQLIALGCDIRSTADAPVRTALNQCRRIGDVLLGGRVVTDGEHTVASDAARRWVWHDGLHYRLLDDTAAQLSIQRREGAGRAMNTSLGGGHRAGSVFSLVLDHGLRPSQGRYAYAVRFQVDRTNAATTASDARVMANDPAQQSVRYGRSGLVQAVLHAPGELALNDSERLRVDAPCIVQAGRHGDGWHIDLADPTQRLPRLAVALSRDGVVVDRLAIALPAAGSTEPTVRWRPRG